MSASGYGGGDAEIRKSRPLMLDRRVTTGGAGATVVAVVGVFGALFVTAWWVATLLMG